MERNGQVWRLMVFGGGEEAFGGEAGDRGKGIEGSQSSWVWQNEWK